ncbi:MAG: hypothetical protein ACRDJS_01655 [Actinomycetota bacterium]
MDSLHPRGIARLIGISLLFASLAYVAGSWEEIVGVSPPSPSAGSVERVVAVPVVIAALRVALVILSVYLTASAVGLLLEGRWLVRAGPSGAEAEPAEMLDYFQDGSLLNEDRLTDMEESVDEIWDVISRLEDPLDGEGDE